MRKRIFSLIIAISMIFAALPIIASADSDIKIGDYVQLGTYYGEPILWRCVDIDENGPLMLSDKILCIKAFDAETSANDKTGSHSHNSYRVYWGSNCWSDSNLRSWLNSAESGGNVQWLCGNPSTKENTDGYNAYDSEAGFLSNFIQSEKNVIKEVKQKSLLAYPEIDAGMSKTGSENHSYSNNISDVVKNYDKSYAEDVTDKVFCLDVKQVNAVYKNSGILGEEYYIGEPTKQCVEQSEYKNAKLNVGKKWNYWLRSPYAYSNYYVRAISATNYVSSYSPHYYGVGVRPAFYLDTGVNFDNGTGAENNPYRFTYYESKILSYDTSDGDVSVKSEVKNNTDKTLSCTLYSAVYSSDGLLKGCGRENKDIAVGTATCDITVPCTVENGDKIKMFMWNDNMAALTETAELKIN